MSEIRFISQETQEEKRARVVARFEQLLASYAAWLEVPRKCTGMGYVEVALLTLVEAAEQQTCPTPNDHVLVAVAGVMGQLAVACQLLESCECSDPASSRRKREKLDWTKEDAIGKSAEWLIANTNETFRVKELLNRQLVKYLPLKSEVISA